MAQRLLESWVERGVRPDRRRLFVIDGSQALRAAIEAVFGPQHPVPRCRKHKLDNVAGHLPCELPGQVKTLLRAAYRLSADEGMAQLQQQARWLEQPYPSAAVSRREGLDETFTIHRLDLPPRLRRCLATTNVIESPTSGVRLRTRRAEKAEVGERRASQRHTAGSSPRGSGPSPAPWCRPVVTHSPVATRSGPLGMPASSQPAPSW